MLEDREERIRRRVADLPAATRKAYHQQVEQELRDPDTYAALNFVFFAGLHHFYLGQWTRGLITLAISALGIGLLFRWPLWGGLLLAGVTAVELADLFRSQQIVARYNLAVQEQALRTCERGTATGLRK